MVTITDVVKCVSGVCESVFGAAPITRDEREPTRPFSVVNVEGQTRGKIGELRRDTFEIAIYRFAENNDRIGWANLLTAKEALANALDGYLTVKTGFLVYPEDVSMELYREDMSLECTFSLTLVQEVPEPAVGVLNMAELEVSL